MDDVLLAINFVLAGLELDSTPEALTQVKCIAIRAGLEFAWQGTLVLEGKTQTIWSTLRKHLQQRVRKLHVEIQRCNVAVDLDGMKADLLRQVLDGAVLIALFNADGAVQDDAHKATGLALFKEHRVYWGTVQGKGPRDSL